MTIKEFLQLVIEYKDYAPLYSALVATGALFLASYHLSSLILFQKIVPREIKLFGAILCA